MRLKKSTTVKRKEDTFLIWTFYSHEISKNKEKIEKNWVLFTKKDSMESSMCYWTKKQSEFFEKIFLLFLYHPVMLSHFSPAPVKTDRAVRIQSTNQVKVNSPSIKQSTERTRLDWLIDFAHFRENCPTGIIPEWMQKVTRHNGIIQYLKFKYCLKSKCFLFIFRRRLFISGMALLTINGDPVLEVLPFRQLDGPLQIGLGLKRCHGTFVEGILERARRKVLFRPESLREKSQKQKTFHCAFFRH